MSNIVVNNLINEKLNLNLDLVVNNETKETFFYASQISKNLGHSNTAMMLKSAGIEDEDKAKIKNPKSGQMCTIISQSGLWLCLMTSSKPCAKKFRNWIAKDVLVQIAKTGIYDSLIEDQVTEIGRGIARYMTMEVTPEAKIVQMEEKKQQLAFNRRNASFSQSHLRGSLKGSIRKQLIKEYGND